MSKIDKYFRLAQITACKGEAKIKRHYRLGAVGIRNDGAIVTSNNIPSQGVLANTHAEARVVRKLDQGSTVYVVRIQRNGELTLARPCNSCQKAMRGRGVKKCYYSISEHEYGVIIL